MAATFGQFPANFRFSRALACMLPARKFVACMLPGRKFDANRLPGKKFAVSMLPGKIFAASMLPPLLLLMMLPGSLGDFLVGRLREGQFEYSR